MENEEIDVRSYFMGKLYDDANNLEPGSEALLRQTKCIEILGKQVLDEAKATNEIDRNEVEIEKSKKAEMREWIKIGSMIALNLLSITISAIGINKVWKCHAADEIITDPLKNTTLNIIKDGIKTIK